MRAEAKCGQRASIAVRGRGRLDIEFQAPLFLRVTARRFAVLGLGIWKAMSEPDY